MYPGQQWFQFPYVILLSMVVVIPAWIIVTLLTRPVSREHLISFYRKVYPGGPGWKHIAEEVPGHEKDGINAKTFLNIGLGVVASNGFLIGTGKLILGAPLSGTLLLGIAVLAGAGLFFSLKKN
jgi:hypothetical protein